MKKFSKICESKQPIDASIDVEEFRNSGLYDELIENGWISHDIDEILDEIEDNSPTMTDDWEVYKVVYESEDEGGNVDVICFVKAISENHAFIKASLIKDDYNIIFIEEYHAYTLNKKGVVNSINNIKSEIRDCEEKLEQLNNILKEL